MKKDPKNCPFCEAEEKGCSSGWGCSPELWEQLRKKHIKEHSDECPCCGQKIKSN